MIFYDTIPTYTEMRTALERGEDVEYFLEVRMGAATCVKIRPTSPFHVEVWQTYSTLKFSATCVSIDDAIYYATALFREINLFEQEALHWR